MGIIDWIKSKMTNNGSCQNNGTRVNENGKIVSCNPNKENEYEGGKKKNPKKKSMKKSSKKKSVKKRV